ncbi:transcription factor TFIIF complex subunit Tfg3 [Mucor velutinosus]|uniref:Transcription factor TFIIF complex subunit Tfg3 n=1 Tax=Mucor velutinosus TaxID=708070 RepID=A0AAN7DNS7_9FUNG|nr:transcription factor TFIIF complex subunit Tfg3 [Mucor velutinosus]
MTTNMNFGPEWMRGKLSKHNSNNGTHFASHDILDSLMPFEDNGSSSHLQFQQQHQQENPFKYSKEFMLSLFKPALQLPSDFKQHEYVTTDACNAPLAFEELTETEKKLLSGPVHSEVSSRKNQRHRGGNDLYASPMQSPASENGPLTPGGSRLGQRKGRSDYFAKDQPIKRGDSSDLLRRRDHSEDMNLSLGKVDEEHKGQPSWAINEGSGLGTFGGGLGSDVSAFKPDALFSGSNGLSGSAPAAPPSSDLSGLSSSSSARKPEDIKWFYRDPSGQVQGPFAAQEMQDWYKAGFFIPTLMLRRDDETLFEPLMVLTQKVGNEDQPFLTPRPTRAPPAGLNGVDMFGSPVEKGSNLFRSGPDLQSKYMPFGSASAAPTTPGGSIMDSFLGSSMSNPMYQSPYNNNFGNPLLRDNRWNTDNQPQASPSWLNPTTPELFGNSSLSSPFMSQQQSTLNPMFGGSNMNSPSLFDYQRSMMDPMDQHQQYNLMLQQKQQQQSMQFQQQFHQMQFQQGPQQQTQQQQQSASPSQQHQQQQQQQQEALQQQPQQQQPAQQQQPQIPQGQSPPAQQNTFKNTPLENLSSINTGIIGSNHASPVMRSNILTGGWGSAPGTPLGGDAPSSPWGSIVSTAIPNKVSEELQSKAPGAQSPRAPSSPTKKPIEKPVKTKTLVESFADIQLAEQKKAADAKAIADAKLAAEAKVAATNAEKAATAAAAAAAAAASTNTDVSPKATPVTPAAVAKPVVSLREIQEEELRIANLKKAKAKQAAITTPSWAASNNTPLSSTTSGTWPQPAHKPLSLREIQEMEAKQATESKKASAAQYLAHQEQLANATPSTLSWGVVVPNSKSSSSNTPSASPSANNAAAWTAPTGPKKTLREIQQEEELAMKKKNAKATKTAAAIAAANASAANSSSPSKTYAATPSAGGAWTTVTNTRAAKPSPAPAPAVIAAPPPQPTQWTPVKAPARAAATTARTSGPSEDFRRWCRKALRGLNSGVNQEEIVSMLLSFPADSGSAEIIEDVIYANSVRIDGKRFAQEFMKRRKADIAGRLDIVTAGLEDEDEDDFKVVVTKKGKKKQSS